ncbi:hypothetical protein V1522DRAFT_439032 [Lipomyces starkeyi]
MSGRGQNLSIRHKHPSVSTIRGNHSALVRTMEEYASTSRKHLMTVGPTKRDYIVSVLARAPPGPEVNPMNAAITSSFVELAGLKDVVDVHVGPAAESVRRLFEEGDLTKQSMCEELGLLHKESTVMADSILIPGAPEHLAYVKKGRAEMLRLVHKYEVHMENVLMSHGHTDQVAVA